ncbi:MAG: MazG family protein, partial [Bdellovibrionia bacterium]
LLQVVFHSEVGREAGVFTIEDVIEAISSKLIRRHPHVFGDVKVSGASEVVDNWEEIKKGEKEKRVRTDRMDVPLGLPALQRAQKIGDKTKKEKFDWDSAAGVMKKLEEEIAELKSELAAKNKSTDKVRMETGDILFTAAQLARHLKLDAEQTLREANQKFERRYMRMRELVSKDGADWTKLSDPEKEAYWSKIKMAEHT